MIYYNFPTKTYIAKVYLNKQMMAHDAYAVDYAKMELVSRVNDGCEGTLGIPVATRWKETEAHDQPVDAVVMMLEVDIWIP
jgi:hypothetical protein